jgi:hypothetical protein
LHLKKVSKIDPTDLKASHFRKAYLSKCIQAREREGECIVPDLILEELLNECKTREELMTRLIQVYVPDKLQSSTLKKAKKCKFSFFCGKLA